MRKLSHSFSFLVLSFAITHLFSPSASAWFGDDSDNPGGYVSRAVFEQNSGLESADLGFFRDDLQKIWSDFVATPTGGESVVKAADQESVNFAALSELNQQAADVWQQMVTCFGTDLKAEANLNSARYAYFNEAKNKSGDFKCTQRKEILEALKVLHLQVNQWVQQTATNEQFISRWTQINNLPLLHPLLGQILAEIYSFHLKSADKYFAGTSGLDADAMPVTEDFIRSATGVCHLPNPEHVRWRPTCENIRPIANAINVTTRLFSMSRDSCLSFGFWPNATLYLYSEKVLLSGVGNVMNHPSERSSADSVDVASCWQNKNLVETSINADVGFTNHFHGAQHNAYLKIYSDFYKFYAEGR